MMELWTIEEVAQKLQVPLATIRWLRQEGKFAPAHKVGRRLRWAPGDIETWLEKQRESDAVQERVVA